MAIINMCVAILPAIIKNQSIVNDFEQTHLPLNQYNEIISLFLEKYIS